MNCFPAPLPTLGTPAGSKGGPPAVAFAGVAPPGGVVASSLRSLVRLLEPETKPQPVLPAWVCAPTPEQMPEGPAQQPEAQSAAFRHWPPMNCLPAPLPMLGTPAGSKGGPPAALVPALAAVVATAAAEVVVSAAPVVRPLEPETNPQPVLPAWVCAPTPEQIPEGPAQQPEAQSAALRHCPPMNCLPAPLPTLGTPAGSKGGPPAVAAVAVVEAAAVVLLAAGGAAEETPVSGGGAPALAARILKDPEVSRTVSRSSPTTAWSL
jgi:hypothetical protein